MLTSEEQIEALKKKGITFLYEDEEKAKEFLEKNNYYLKIKSYKNNFFKFQNGKNKGKYIDLDFAYLKDLSIIDYYLRMIILKFCLNIEHYFKLHLINRLKNDRVDEYNILLKFKQKYEEEYKSFINSNYYTESLIKKYSPNLPISVFLEVISFGTLVRFYEFCSEYINDKEMKKEFYLLNSCREIRNAAAHNSCILNNIKGEKNRKISINILQEISKIDKISKQTRTKKLKSEVLRQLVSVFYTNYKYITSEKIRENNSKEVKVFLERLYSNIKYYKNNDFILSSFDFLKKILDNWYSL